MKAMIISVGGSPEPIVTSLLKHRPDFVCFFATQKSMDLIGGIKEKTKEHSIVFDDCKVIADDENDLVHCYTKACECAARCEQRQFAAADIHVDYTGGTKSMTAALTLATIAKGYGFSYVGGAMRTKDGLGTVVSGTEIIHEGISPAQLFALEDKQRLAVLISHYQYEAAVAVLQHLPAVMLPADREIAKGLIQVLEGYHAWDAFQHTSASKLLSGGIKHLDICCKFSSSAPLLPFYKRCQENLAILQRIQEATRGFKALHPLLLLDLVSNAERRIHQGKYDDAVARLYRALEMAGQIAFEETFKVSTSEVPISMVPESMRDEYSLRYAHPEKIDHIQLPLFAVFRMLKQIGHPQGERFEAHRRTFEDLLFTRNHSILAHGLNPIKADTAASFLQKMTDIFLDDPLIRFPQELNW